MSVIIDLVNRPTYQAKTRKFTDLQLSMLLMGLRFEVQTGMYMTDPRKIGGSCYSIAKREFGFTGNKKKVLSQLETYCKGKIRE